MAVKGFNFLTVLEPTFTGGGLTVKIDSLRISNITQEGPEKVYKGGLYNKTHIKYGRTMRIEMEDVICTPDVLKLFFGATGTDVLSFKNTFVKQTYAISGTTRILKENGEVATATFSIPKFLPDQLLNLNLEVDGDFAVLDMAGEIQFDEATEAFYTINGLPADS